MLAESDRVVQRLADVFEALNIPYFVGGSVASSVHGIPRLTQDVDMVARIEGVQIPAIVAALESEFYIDADMIQEAVAHASSFNVLHLDTMVKADIFLPPRTPWQESKWVRRRQQVIASEPDALSVYVASPEDMVLQKLEWYRLTGERSDRQWGDVLGILKVQGTSLDFAYMAHWAEELGLTELYRAALEDSGLPG